MKKPTKAQKIRDCFVAFKAAQKNEIPKRTGAKDGSRPTHSTIDVPDLSEAIVLKDCLKWLNGKGILANRNNVGSGRIGESGFYNYGIKNGGDIIGLLPDGQHFEIECKRGRGGRLSAGQQKRLRDIKKNNGLYFIAHSWMELELCMRNLV